MPRPSNEVERDRAAATTEVDDPFEGCHEWRESRRLRRKGACLAPRLRVRSSLRNMFIDRSCKSQRASGFRAARRRRTSAGRDRKGGKGKERHPRRHTHAHPKIVGPFAPGYVAQASIEECSLAEVGRSLPTPTPSPLELGGLTSRLSRCVTAIWTFPEAAQVARAVHRRSSPCAVSTALGAGHPAAGGGTRARACGPCSAPSGRQGHPRLADARGRC